MATARVVAASKHLPHQIIIGNVQGNGKLSVSCNCAPVWKGNRKVLEQAPQGTDSGDLMALWLTTTHRPRLTGNDIAAAKRATVYRLP